MDNSDFPGDPLATPPPRGQGRAALMIVIQSWLTIPLAVLTLLLGLALGYFIPRPGAAPAASATAPAAAQETAPAAAQEVSPAAAQEASPTARVVLPTQDRSAQQAALMEAVLGQVRHFKGSADAPVTLIEFSDFQ